MKIIRIENCSDCPNVRKGVSLSSLTEIASCAALYHQRLPRKELILGGIKYGLPTYTIPEWCPLEDAKQ